MDVDNDAKKVIWSLQNNVRSEEERNVFKPTGKKPKSNNWKYVTVVLIGLLAISYVMVQFQKKEIYVCLLEGFCFHSKNDKTLYLFYVFITNVIIIMSIYFAYKVGKKLSEKLQR